MPVTFTSSSVYIEEIPNGVCRITRAATAGTGSVGRVLLGPTKEPPTVNSVGNLEDRFSNNFYFASTGDLYSYKGKSL